MVSNKEQMANNGFMEKYQPEQIEKKWQAYWKKHGTFTDYSKKEKFYALDMFPYPSGAGLHVGHPKGYVATDIVARFEQMRGKSVLHPMGWDAFGLPAENYAIKNKIHPKKAVEENIARFKEQLEKIGFTYDWDREINTTNPEYYKWTQWIFLQMFENGLAYQSEEPVNWCASCKTVLANEDLEGGKCERCGGEITQRPLRQWVLKMTDYAERLLADLDTEELEWERSIVEQQKNWIGRSKGVTVSFPLRLADSAPPPSGEEDFSVEVFTTRVDTIFGCTYVVIAPEHSFISEQVTGDGEQVIRNLEEVSEYVEQAKKKTAMERGEMNKEKTGVKLEGVEAVNPFTGESVLVFVADYVLGNYGTGAVMAVPAHDERDWEFAKKYGCEIVQTISQQQAANSKQQAEECYTEDGILIDSGEFTGLASEEAREKMAEWLEEKGLGKRTVTYKMRDWVFSRQRYWGEPIPIVHCEKCGAVGVPEEELPVKLPEVASYEPADTGESPLANIEEWVNTKCPKCGGAAKRETNTMPQWAGSSWYHLAYIAKSDAKFQVPSSKLYDEWLPVDLYVGGAEHATRHLLYARFWHKFLYDIGVVGTKEPFRRLVHVGLINAEDGRKMSKRWGNVINPDDVVAEFGADSLRLYEMFMGPFTQNIAWSTEALSGMRRFLEKVWRLSERVTSDKGQVTRNAQIPSSKFQDSSLEALLHKTIKKVTEDIEGFRFNTAIAALMTLVNRMEREQSLPPTTYHLLTQLLSPFAPHISEELWEKLGNKQSIFLEPWPEWDEALIVDESIMLVVQVNGKVRDKIEASADISEDDAKKLALESEKVKKFLEGKDVKKVIFVKGKLVNVVI